MLHILGPFMENRVNVKSFFSGIFIRYESDMPRKFETVNKLIAVCPTI